MKRPDVAPFNYFDKSSTYTANNRGDNLPPCLTLFETVKKLDVDWSYFETTVSNYVKCFIVVFEQSNIDASNNSEQESCLTLCNTSH